MSVLSLYLNHSGKAASREKIFRLIQYCSKLIRHYLNDPELLQRIKQMETILSTSRKTFRLGKSVDMLHNAKQAYSIPDSTLRNLLVCSHISYAGYFMYDLLLWCVKAGVLKTDSQQSWSKKSMQFWCCGLICNLLRDLNEVRVYYQQPARKDSALFECFNNNPAVLVDLMKNMADLVVALDGLQTISLSQGTTGLCGVISSIMGLLQVVAPKYKLLP